VDVLLCVAGASDLWFVVLIFRVEAIGASGVSALANRRGAPQKS
jgi:hypothetical protein